MLILGAVREIRLMLLVWMLATIAALIWEFVLLSILFSYDTTIGHSKSSLASYKSHLWKISLTFLYFQGFVVGLAVMQLLGFSVFCFFLVIVFSFYQVIYY